MSPYERAWRRMMRTGKPSLYFQGGRWHVAHTATALGASAAMNWVYAR